MNFVSGSTFTTGQLSGAGGSHIERHTGNQKFNNPVSRYRFSRSCQPETDGQFLILIFRRNRDRGRHSGLFPSTDAISLHDNWNGRRTMATSLNPVPHLIAHFIEFFRHETPAAGSGVGCRYQPIVQCHNRRPADRHRLDISSRVSRDPASDRFCDDARTGIHLLRQIQIR